MALASLYEISADQEFFCIKDQWPWCSESCLFWWIVESRDIVYVFIIHSFYSFVCVIILKSCGLFVYTYSVFDLFSFVCVIAVSDSKSPKIRDRIGYIWRFSIKYMIWIK